MIGNRTIMPNISKAKPSNMPATIAATGSSRRDCINRPALLIIADDVALAVHEHTATAVANTKCRQCAANTV